MKRPRFAPPPPEGRSWDPVCRGGYLRDRDLHWREGSRRAWVGRRVHLRGVCKVSILQVWPPEAGEVVRM